MSNSYLKKASGKNLKNELTLINNELRNRELTKKQNMIAEKLKNQKVVITYPIDTNLLEAKGYISQDILIPVIVYSHIRKGGYDDDLGAEMGDFVDEFPKHLEPIKFILPNISRAIEWENKDEELHRDAGDWDDPRDAEVEQRLEAIYKQYSVKDSYEYGIHLDKENILIFFKIYIKDSDIHNYEDMMKLPSIENYLIDNFPNVIMVKEGKFLLEDDYMNSYTGKKFSNILTEIIPLNYGSPLYGEIRKYFVEKCLYELIYR